jgi:preprotein translocase subunit YajC
MGAIIIFIVLAVMWVLLAVPRQREARRHNAVMASLQVGDEVMTGGGIFGTVDEIGDDHVLLEVAPGMVMKVTKRAVASKVEPDGTVDLAADSRSDSNSDSGADTAVGSSDRSED